jgi:hypothetical protein
MASGLRWHPFILCMLARESTATFSSQLSPLSLSLSLSLALCFVFVFAQWQCDCAIATHVPPLPPPECRVPGFKSQELSF